MMATTLSPYVEAVDFGYAVRMGFHAQDDHRRPTTVMFGRTVPAAQAVAELRDLANRIEARWCPETIVPPPAAPVSPMSAQYGS